MYYYDSSQHIFDRALWAMVAIGKWLVQALVYLPLWFCGYLISTTFLQKNDSVWAWLASTIVFAVVIYQLLFFCKGLLIGLRSQKSAWWIPLFLLCCAFSCIAPAGIIYYTIEPIVKEWTTHQSHLLSGLISLAFAYWVYSRYHFLTNIAPAAAFAAYQFGIDCARHWGRFATYIPPKKATRWI